MRTCQKTADVNECVGDVDTDGTLWVTVLRGKRCPPGRDTDVGLGVGAWDTAPLSTAWL